MIDGASHCFLASALLNSLKLVNGTTHRFSTPSPAAPVRRGGVTDVGDARIGFLWLPVLALERELRGGHSPAGKHQDALAAFITNDRRWVIPRAIRRSTGLGPSALRNGSTAPITSRSAAVSTYDGVDIHKLSPGTRGIVLLLLYLALDDSDDRPVIIDQPEENLDPKSIFDELVGLFIYAKARRQVIMVTHNANLVINTDADQIIIATAGPHVSGDLPPIKCSHIRVTLLNRG
jgi:AAA domain, putative AbiEii toxin, Type IV TA system